MILKVPTFIGLRQGVPELSGGQISSSTPIPPENSNPRATASMGRFGLWGPECLGKVKGKWRRNEPIQD
jgi:hypothetical protein